MKVLTFFVILELIGTALGGGSSLCEPFLSNFRAFDQVLLNLLDDVQQYSTSSSNDPALATSYAFGLKSEANKSIVLAAKAISRLSGVDPSVIINILNGTASQPFAAPLDCISTDLIFLKEKYSDIFTNVVPAIAARKEALSAPSGLCIGIVARIASYLPSAVTMTSSKSATIAGNLAAFSSIGMSDLYREYILSVDIFEIIGSALADVLNTDASAALSYIRGESSDLPYPFSCFKFLIDYFKDSFMTQVIGILDGTATSLSFPSLF